MGLDEKTLTKVPNILGDVHPLVIGALPFPHSVGHLLHLGPREYSRQCKVYTGATPLHA